MQAGHHAGSMSQRRASRAPLNTSPLPSVVFNRSLLWTKRLVCADAKSPKSIATLMLRSFAYVVPRPSHLSLTTPPSLWAAFFQKIYRTGIGAELRERYARPGRDLIEADE